VKAKSKPKPLLPRRAWKIKPVTRVKESAKIYSRTQFRKGTGRSPGVADVE
jgi:hypothetical protein